MTYKPTEKDLSLAQQIISKVFHGKITAEELAQELCKCRIEAYQKGIRNESL